MCCRVFLTTEYTALVTRRARSFALTCRQHTICPIVVADEQMTTMVFVTPIVFLWANWVEQSAKPAKEYAVPFTVKS